MLHTQGDQYKRHRGRGLHREEDTGRDSSGSTRRLSAITNGTTQECPVCAHTQDSEKRTAATLQPEKLLFFLAQKSEGRPGAD